MTVEHCGMRQPTAREVVDADIPGGLNVFIRNQQATIQAKGQSFFLDLGGDTKVPTVPVGEDITLAVEIENNATTGAGNPDTCGGSGSGDGTALRLVLSGGIEGSVERCIEDSTFASGPTVETVGLTFRVPDAGLTYYTDIWVEGATSGVRVTPKYRLALFTQSLENRDGETDFDDDDPISDDPQLPEFEFNLGDFDYSCSVSKNNITAGESVEVEVDFEGALPPDVTNDPDATGSREIGVYLFANGDQIGEDDAYITTNGSGRAEFELVDLPVGEYEVGYELEDRGWA
mgnify:CR=1 FL=1